MQDLYQQHLNEMFGSVVVEKYPPEDVDRILDRLLQCLPNNGKLYKYRKINDEKSFQYTYQMLKNGKLWTSRVDKFPDKTDCVVNFDPMKDSEDLKKLFLEKPQLFVKGIMISLSRQVENVNPYFDATMLTRMSDCFDNETLLLNEEKALEVFADYGCDKIDSIFSIKMIKRFIEQFIEKYDQQLKEMVENLLKINEKCRHQAFVCSLCEDYTVKTMWENYADNNGICIEYDFNKLRNMPCETKRFFLNTYKVNYAKEYPECSLVPLVEMQLEGNQNLSENLELNKQLLISTITKSDDYAYEKEWRTYHVNLDDEADGVLVDANIVSGIIFDEQALNTENGRRLLELARERNWCIKVRKLNCIGTKYLYNDIV